MYRLLFLFAIFAAGCISARPAIGQQSVVAEKFVVASGHREASEIGLQVLRDGGNVIDAAIATSFALGVAEPYGSGLGGKLIMLYRDGATGEVHSIVALCTSPAELDDLEFIQLSSSERKYGYKAVGVPGLVAGLDEAFRRWGSLPWSDLVKPAAKLAEEGVEINAVMRGNILPKVKYLKRDEQAASLYLANGKAPPVGAVMKNADLADTLNKIAAGGADAFYQGEIAELIVSAARKNGSDLSREDFQSYRAEYGQPLEIDYRGFKIYSCPPPLTGGVTVLSVLKCLEAMHSESIQDHAAFTDGMCRALQCYYPAIRDTVADVFLARNACEFLMDDNSVRKYSELAKGLNPEQPYDKRGKLKETETTLEASPSASTSHLVVADSQGNMVSLTQSLSLHFGASVVPPGTGIVLNDSLSNFATHNRGAVNHVDSGKRARSTIAPIIALKDGKPWLTLGIPGGQRIPTTTLQLLWRLMDRGDSLADAFGASRFHLRRPLRAAEAANVIDYEEDADASWVKQLESRGWQLKKKPRDGHYFGGGNAAHIREDGKLVGVADPRRTNFAAGE